MAKVKFDFNKPPKEAISYLQDKGLKLSFDYNEIIKQAHDKAFTVAKVTRLDLLNDIHNAINDAMNNGIPFKEFQKNIKPTLQKKGWWGEKEIVNPSTGEIKTVKIDSRRIKNIYSTNMRVAYSKARYQEQLKLPISVYFRYVSALLENTRTDHKILHNTVLPREHIFWDTNYPLNGWGCVCKVMAISKKEALKRGYKILDTAPSSVASKDWNYNPAKNKVSQLSKIDLDKSLDALPIVNKNKDYETMSDTTLTNLFYEKMNHKKGDMFIDKVGDPMIIDDGLFTSASGHSKIKVKDRHLILDEMVETLKNPDEIYLEFDIGKITGEERLIKKMFRYVNIDGKKRAVVAMFEYLKDKTQGITLHLLNTDSGVEKKRVSKLIYQRESD